MIELNKAIKKEDAHKETILKNVEFVKNSEPLFKKAIKRKNTEIEGLEMTKEFGTQILAFETKIQEKITALTKEKNLLITRLKMLIRVRALIEFTTNKHTQI